jgi:hypothetical protein
MVPDNLSQELLAEVVNFSSSLVTDRCETPKDALLAGLALMVAAEQILRHLGGARFAAEQFYRTADRCVARLEPESP